MISPFKILYQGENRHKYRFLLDLHMIFGITASILRADLYLTPPTGSLAGSSGGFLGVMPVPELDNTCIGDPSRSFPGPSELHVPGDQVLPGDIQDSTSTI